MRPKQWKHSQHDGNVSEAFGMLPRRRWRIEAPGVNSKRWVCVGSKGGTVGATRGGVSEAFGVLPTRWECDRRDGMHWKCWTLALG